MGPSLITIEHARAVQAARPRPASRPARSGRRLAALQAVVATAFVALAFAVVASSASARAIEAPGTPQVSRQVATPSHAASQSESGGIGATTVIILFGGTVLVVAGGAWLLDAVGKHVVPRRVR